MREHALVDRRFVYNFIQNQNELDDYAVDVMQFYTVLSIHASVFEVQLRQQEKIETSHCRSTTIVAKVIAI